MAASDYITNPQITGPGVNMAAELYKMISGLPDAYQTGVEQRFKRGQYARTEELQKPIVDAQGRPITDYNKLLEVYLQKSGTAGIPQALELSKFPMTLEAQRQFQRSLDNPDEGSTGDPSTRTDAQRPELLKPQLGAEPPEGMVNPARIGNQAQNLTGPTIQPSGMGGPAPQPMTPNAVRTVPAPPLTAAQLGREPEAQPTTATGVKSDAEIAALRRGAANLARAAASPLITPAQKDTALALAKQKQEQADKAQELRDKITAERAKLTKGQKEALPGMSVQETAAQAEAMKGAAAAKTKNLAARIEGMKPAQDSIQVLDEMSDAFRHGGTNISTGPGAKQWLKVKQAVNNMAPGFFKGVAESEEIEKLNAYLSAAVAKAMTARPTQYEFKAFQEQNPGLLTSREGSAALTDILRQTKVQELQLGRLADKFKVGGDKSWSEVEEQYFRDHPIISPHTHMPIDAKQARDGKWYRPDPDRPGLFMEVRAK